MQWDKIIVFKIVVMPWSDLFSSLCNKVINRYQIGFVRLLQYNLWFIWLDSNCSLNTYSQIQNKAVVSHIEIYKKSRQFWANVTTCSVIPSMHTWFLQHLTDLILQKATHLRDRAVRWRQFFVHFKYRYLSLWHSLFKQFCNFCLRREMSLILNVGMIMQPLHKNQFIIVVRLIIPIEICFRLKNVNLYKLFVVEI